MGIIKWYSSNHSRSFDTVNAVGAQRFIILSHLLQNSLSKHIFPVNINKNCTLSKKTITKKKKKKKKTFTYRHILEKLKFHINQLLIILQLVYLKQHSNYQLRYDCEVSVEGFAPEVHALNMKQSSNTVIH